MAAEEMSNFCGQCHRTWETVVGLRLFGEKNVRFQPYRLANSQCFLGDDKRIRCTACHDPHAALVREDASYDRAASSIRWANSLVTFATLTPLATPKNRRIWICIQDMSNSYQAKPCRAEVGCAW
jgi:hypothetical protein